MILDRASAWIGPLSKAPTEVTSRVRDEPSMKVLLNRGWRAERTLLYVPPRREGYDLNVVVVGRNVNVGDDRPILWMFSTVGLDAVQQVRRGAARAFRRIELVLVLSNSEREEPFPTRLGVVLAQEPDPFPGWDWSQVEIPPLVDWLSVAGEELGAAIKSGATFGVQDTLTLGPGAAAWTRSRLNHSVLLPSNAHMQDAGFAPFDPTTSHDSIDPTNWNNDPGTERYSSGFYWLLPVTHSEYDAANAGGTWNMFADLVQKSHKLGGDDFALSYDLLR